MAAETLTRARVRRPPAVLARVVARDREAPPPFSDARVGGYLLVSVFFAYDVLLYLITTRVFGWWSPAEALLHPDVLATYAPWLSAIANSFQAGFWEECLFRAVPIAGAALIGDRFGQRRLFLVIGVRRAGDHLRRRPRAVSEPAVVRPAGRADPARRSASACSTSTSGCSPASSCTSRSTSSGSRCRSSSPTAPWHPVPAVHGRGADAGAAVDRAVAPTTRKGSWTVLAYGRTECGLVTAAADEFGRRSGRRRGQLAVGASRRLAWLVAGGVALAGLIGRGRLAFERTAVHRVTREQAADTARRALANRRRDRSARNGA